MLRTVTVAAVLLLAAAAPAPASAQVTAELDAYWAELARTVAEGDYDGYAAGYHQDAVLVSLQAGGSFPIAEALAGWKQGFDDTREGRIQAGVEFRFTKRLNDATTAHETGMFRYFSRRPGEDPDVALLHFEALLVKRDGEWLTVMEFQKEEATEAEWEASG